MLEKHTRKYLCGRVWKVLFFIGVSIIGNSPIHETVPVKRNNSQTPLKTNSKLCKWYPVREQENT